MVFFICTVKPAYKGIATGRIFSVAGCFRLTRLHEVKLKILGAVKVFC